MSDLFNYSNTSLLGSVIEGYSYNVSIGKIQTPAIKGYVVDKITLASKEGEEPINAYVTVALNSSVTVYTTIAATDLVLTSIFYIPASQVVSVLEFPSSNPLITQSQGLKGARIQGNYYNTNTGRISNELVEGRIIDRTEMKKGEKVVNVFVGVKTSGTGNLTGGEVIYIPTNLVKSIVEFGTIDPGPYSSLRYTTLNFALDATNSAIIFYDVVTTFIVRVEVINTIQAVANGTTGIRIQKKGGLEICVDALELAGIFINGVLVTQVQVTAIAELNNLFLNSGGLSGNLPVISSTNTILLTAGNNINHTVTGTNIVSVDFDISTTGTVPVGNITQVDFERRKIIGGSSLAAGTYNIIATAYNYFGQVSQTIQVIVSAAFTNTYSFEAGSGVATYNAGTINSVPLYRPADGTGASDAWSIMCWYKMKTAHKYDFNYPWGFGYIYGGTGCVAFQHRYNTLKVYFGVSTQYITITCTKPHGYDDWHCCLLTYTGNSTGTSTANAGNQFNMYIDGVLMTAATNALTVTQNAGTNGYTGPIEKATNSHAVDMCIGGLCSVTGTVKNSDTDPVDEVAIWASELSASDAVALYGGSSPGTPIDLGLFTPAYSNWWRNGDNGDIASFPVLNDMNASGCDLTVAGGSVANYISDVP